MKTTSLLYAVFISSFIIVLPTLSLSQTRLTVAPAGEVTTVPGGFCCSNGQVISASQAQCKQKRGQYYPGRAEALRHCRAATVFCCINGKVSEISPEQCKRSQGTAYTTGAEAKRKCRPEAVYCCLKGKIKTVSPDECRKVKGTAYTTASEAKRKCKPEAVYCCLKGKIKTVSPGECRKVKGTAYRTASEAKRKCKPEAVYCCLKGKIKTVSPDECRKVKGTAYRTDTEARRKCKPEAVYCCLKGNVKKVSAGECKKKKGKPYRTEREARKNCGWCCAENKVFSTTPGTCKKKGGNYFTSKTQADNECKKQPQCCVKGRLFIYPKRECDLKKGKYYRSYREAKNQCRVVVRNLRPTISDPDYLRPRIPSSSTPTPPPPEPPKPTVLAPSFVDQQQIPDLNEPQAPGPLQWPSLVDLAIIDISITPSQPRLGRSFLVATTIKNIGLATPQKNAFFQMELTDDPYTLFLKNIVEPFGRTIPLLIPNEEHIITKSVALPRQFTYPNNLQVDLQGGNYKIRALINTSNFEIDEERNSDNNEMTKTFVVRNPAPSDLAMDNIQLTSDCRVRFKFHNDGAAIPDPDFNNAQVAIEMGDLRRQKNLSEVDPAGLSKDGSSWWGSSPQYVTYTWRVPDPNWTIDLQLTSGQTASVTVKLNPYRNINEEIVTNNNMTRSLTCP